MLNGLKNLTCHKMKENGGLRQTLRHLLTSYRFQIIQLTSLTLRTSPRKFTEKITVDDA